MHLGERANVTTLYIFALRWTVQLSYAKNCPVPQLQEFKQ